MNAFAITQLPKIDKATYDAIPKNGGVIMPIA